MLAVRLSGAFWCVLVGYWLEALGQPLTSPIGWVSSPLGCWLWVLEVGRSLGSLGVSGSYLLGVRAGVSVCLAGVGYRKPPVSLGLVLLWLWWVGWGIGVGVCV